MLRQFLTVEYDLASGGTKQLEDGQSGCRLAATTLADQAEGFTTTHYQVDSINRFDGANFAWKEGATLDRKMDLQVGQREQGFSSRFGTGLSR